MSEENKLVSLSGAPIYRHDQEKPFQIPDGEMHLEAISAHIEQWIGPVAMVWHELISDTVHIDVHHVAPTAERPYHTLITSGMSDLPMNVPANCEAPRRLELMITLPAHWQISEAAFEQENWYWPVRQLKFMARLPHKYNTWLGWGHTVPNGDPAEALAPNTRLSGLIVLPSVHVPEEFWQLPLEQEGITIDFMSILPLYREEMDLKLREGSDALLERFDKHGITDIVDVARRNVAKKRFGLF